MSGARSRHLVAAGLSLCAAAVAAGAQDETRPFALPLARDALTLAENASDHLAAQRWSEALADLQRMIEEHRGEVLPDEYRESAGLHTWHAAHPGAAEWARRHLLALPADARALYRDRYGPRALRALELARKTGNRRALVEVARRWPLSSAAVRAWWTLGDLEIENGHPRDALISWKRAWDVVELLDEELPASALARREQALELLARSTPGVSSFSLEEALSAEDLTARRGPLPKNDAQPWSSELDLEPLIRRPAYSYSLFPVLDGNRVFVSSTLRLFAVDSFTGELDWEAGPPEGWPWLSTSSRADLYPGLNDEQLLVSPAIGGRIVVAALQIPWTADRNENWQGIEIMRGIPERRLYAFDAETGAGLWNHCPEMTWEQRGNEFRWDGSGSFAQRMMVAGSPVVAGTRLLVPSIRMRGRIDYHVACYELGTGELMWSTNVVSGQRPRNMFGRARREFVASPLVIAGETVICQTELGTVAALDMITGELRWESLYRQIALPKTRSYSSPDRDVRWRLAPPVVVGDVVISTPSDSHDLVAFHLEDGRVLWTESQERLSRLDRTRPSLRFNLLIGADEERVYLGGQKVGALAKPGGLASGPGFELLWMYAVDSENRSNADRTARALLGRDVVIVPLKNERIVLDRRSGEVRYLEGGAWDFAHYGNILVEDGTLFTLGRTGLNGFFDWNALLTRQRERQASRPDDPAIALDTARLYARRAESVYEKGELFAALSFLEEASSILVPLRQRLSAEEGARLLRQATDELHLVLRTRAKALEGQGNPEGALAALEAARPLAPTRTAVRDTLLHKERLLRGQDTAEYVEVLAELERQCSDLSLPEDLRVVAASETLRRLFATRAPENAIPVGLWVSITRAELHSRLRRMREALADWHGVLSSYGDFEIVTGTSAEDLARDQIGALLMLPGGRLAYEPFEQGAAELYAQGLESGDPTRLQEVSRRFPHSRAAVDALRAFLDWAYQADDAEAVASIVYTTLATKSAVDDDLPLLLRLGRVLGRKGNPVFERELLAALVRENPDRRSDLPEHEGRLLREILDELILETPAPESLASQFDETVSAYGPSLQGPYDFLGKITPAPPPSEASPQELHVYLVDQRLEAFSNRGQEHPVWYVPLGDGLAGASACTVEGERIVVGSRSAVFGIDAEGHPTWSRRTGDLPVRHVVSHAGVVLVLVGETDPERVLALDVAEGTPLWEMHLGAEGRWSRPVFGEGRVVFFSQIFGKDVRARVVDLFRGTLVSENENLGRIPNDHIYESAWIADGNLLVPKFAAYGRTPNGVTAYDLTSARERWSVGMRENETFHSIARYDGKDYLVTVAASPSSNGAIYALDTAHGTLRTIVPLRVGEAPVGLRERTRTELSAPYLFTLTDNSSDRGVPLRAIHLPYQFRWSFTLPLSYRELYHNDSMPVPAVSAECVAMAFVTYDPNMNKPGEALLLFLDKNTGTRLDTRILEEGFSRASRLELRGLGDSLFVVGHSSQTRGLKMQILEKIR